MTHHHIQQNPKRIDVRPLIHPLTVTLLRTHKLRRPHDHPVLRVLVRRLVPHLGYPKIENLHRITTRGRLQKHHVLGLQIPVDNSRLMDRPERIRQLKPNIRNLTRRKYRPLLDIIRQRPAVHILHHNA